MRGMRGYRVDIVSTRYAQGMRGLGRYMRISTEILVSAYTAYFPSEICAGYERPGMRGHLRVSGVSVGFRSGVRGQVFRQRKTLLLAHASQRSLSGLEDLLLFVRV